MKKITFLFILLISTLANAQGPWEFNNDHTGWTEGACSATDTPTTVILTTNGGTNPTFGNLTAGIDATNNKYAAITLKNSANGPTFLRVSYPNGTGGRVFKATTISTGDASFITYYIDLTNANWTGTVDDVKLHFKTDDGSSGGANYTSTGETIEIDKIEFVQYPERYVYEFNTDTENWTENNATVTVSGGVLTIDPTVGTSGKAIQSLYSTKTVNASWIHIVYKNNSALNNQIRFQFKYDTDGFVSFKGTNVAINQSMGAFEVLSIDLSAIAEWSGANITKDFQIILRDTNNAGNVASAGTFEIERIEFNNSSTLSNNSFNSNTSKVSLYPNPANESISFTSFDEVESVSIYDITGKKVIDVVMFTNNSINVSDLNSGIYFTQITLLNGSSKTIKFIKK